MKPNKSFWAGKEVLLTGHSGFKGSWLSLWLHSLGAIVTGVSLSPSTKPNLYSLSTVDKLIKSRLIDIRDSEQLSALVQKTSPDIVFHLAAQPLVRASYRNPLDTYSTNVMGTANLLDSLRGILATKVAVIVTTDKVYRDQRWPYPYRENDELGGHDPYAASKAASEIIVASYRDAFLKDQNVAVATARAGNVIGGGDWSDDRLFPDAVRAWQSGQPLEIRNPQAVRPWQHVLEPLTGYLKLAENLWHKPNLAGAYNFGPETATTATVREVIEYASSCYGVGKINWGNASNGPHETDLLALDISKANTYLDFTPKWSLHESISRTMKWYSKQASGDDSRKLCLSEITEFEAIS